MRVLSPLDTDTLLSIQLSLNYEIRRTDVAKAVRDGLPEIVFEEEAWIASHALSPAGDFEPAEFDNTLKRSMLWLYENAFGERSAEQLRAELLALGRRGCPYCHAANAPTLDHMYPKASHPRLAVTPRNLVPCCRDCNTERGRYADSIALDPYSDSWSEDGPWVTARVPNTSDCAILKFEIETPPTWDKRQVSRATNLFHDAAFAKRYSVSAAIEMYDRAPDLLLILEERGLDALYAALEREKTTHARKSANYWATIAYTAWVRDFSSISWFTSLETAVEEAAKD